MKTKKIITHLFTVLIILFFSLSAHSQDRKETLNLSDFDEVHMGTAGEVYIKQGNKVEVVIEASERRKESLDIEVRGGRLYIKNKRGWNWRDWARNGDLTVYITMGRIEALKVSSSGRIIGEGVLKTDDMDLAVSGSGRIEIETEARDLASSISGSGRILLTGKCTMNDVSISGSGRLLAEDMESEEYYISISGSGNCKINVSKAIDARVSGSGRIYYTGNPDKVHSKISGSGSVKKI